MDVINFSNIESQILTSFNQGKKTFEAILEASHISEKTLSTVIEGLISKNILKLNTGTKEYEYQSKVNGEMVILDGNILLPTTIIKMADKLLVCRGEWYSFPVDFDTRRIIWNVKLEQKTNSTLVDLIKTSVLKQRKSKIVQVEEYISLQNKIVPYSPTLGLLLNTIGESVTAVSLIFKIKLGTDDLFVEHRGFTVETEIDTAELISQIEIPVAERDYTKIKLNKIYNFSDFLFSKNEIPIAFTTNTLTYIKITGIKKSFEFTTYLLDLTGNKKQIDIEVFEDSDEAINKLRELFKGFAMGLLTENSFFVEMTE